MHLMSGLVNVLRNVEFEQKAVRRPPVNAEKELVQRDEGLVQLWNREYERYPYVREYFALSIASEEGKLSKDLQAVLDDMNQGYGEWFFDVVLTDGQKITFYDGVNNSTKQPLKYSAKKTFKLNGLRPQKYYTTEQVFNANPRLGKNIWTKDYDKLPDKIKTQSGIFQPPKDVIRPVGRGYFVSDCDVYAYICIGRASRGVVVGQKKSEQ